MLRLILIVNLCKLLRIIGWTITTSYETLLMTVSNKYQHCRVLKRGSKTGQQIDAPVKYVADLNIYIFFYFVYIMFVNSWFELLSS